MQKKWNKLFAVSTSAALVASVIVPVSTGAETTYKDVTSKNTHYKAITELSKLDIVSGYPDSTFKPNATLSRSNIIKMLGRYLVEKEGVAIPNDYATNPRFNDIKNSKDNELKKYAAVVYETGIFVGSNGNLYPSSDMTRENIAVVLIRLLNYLTEKSVNGYVKAKDHATAVKDLDRAKYESRDAIKTLEYFGITVVANYRPKESTTRGQFASMLYRILMEIIDSKTIMDDIKKYEGNITNDIGTIVINNPGTGIIVSDGAVGSVVVVKDKNGNVLGSGVINYNGNLTIILSRPLQLNETVIIVGDNGQEYPFNVDTGGQQPVISLEQLRNAITLADRSTRAEVSTDGSTIPQTKYWTTQTAKDAFELAIAQAKAILTNPNATQSEVNAATQSLLNALVTYEGAKKLGTASNKVALGNMIERANGVVKVAVSSNGNDIPTTEHWTTAEAKAAFERAIADSKAVYDNANATQEQILAATNMLESAIVAYEAAKQLGKQTTVNKTALSSAIGLANSMAIVQTSTNGEDILATELWTTTTAKNAFQTAILSAQTIFNSATATQSQIDAEVTSLNAAIAAYSIAKQIGKLQQAPVNKAGLTAILNTADSVIKVATSANGLEIPTTELWTTPEQRTAFETAVINAKNVLNNSSATQAEVDDAIAKVTAAITAYNEAKQLGKQPGADAKDVLEDVLSVANNVQIVDTSENGSDIPSADKWTTEDALDAFETAKAAAQTVKDDPNATTDEIADAAEALQEAIVAYEAAKQDGQKVVKENLISAIEATNAMEKYDVSSDGSDIPKTEFWTTQAELDALEAAIEAAQVVATDPDATQEEVDAAVTDLAEAVEAYEGAKASGTKEAPSDKAALTDKIADATAGKVAVSEDGSDVPTTEQWTTQAELDALEVAIEAAEAVAADPDATQAEVDAAVTDLATALTAYEKVKEKGTKEAPSDKAALTDKIADAAAGKVAVSEDGSDIPKTEFWTTQAELAALEAAIEAAEAVAADPDATQEEVDAAVTDLADALEAYEAVKASGTKEALSDKAALTDKIADAAAGKVAVSEDGSDIPKTEFWTTQAELDALEAAIEAAQAVAADPNATQEEVDAAVTNLATALTAYEKAKEKGTKEAAQTPLELAQEAITNAQEKVDAAEVTPNDETIAEAETAISEARDAIGNVLAEDRQPLTDELDAIEQQLNDVKELLVAQEKVEAAEQAVESVNLLADVADAQAAIDDAQAAIDQLEDGNEKTELQTVLDEAKESLVQKEAQFAIDEAAEKVAEAEQALADAEDLVAAGKLSEADEAIAVAEQAIDAVKDEEKKAELQTALDAIKDDLNALKEATGVELLLTVAEQAVAKAQANSSKETFTAATEAINAAQNKIDSLSEPEKSENQLLLDDIKENFEKIKLYEAIEAAKSEKVAVSTDGKNIEPSEEWTSASELADFEAAIQAAESTLANSNATLQNIADAMTALDAAIVDYEAAKKPGLKQPPVDTTALADIITDAKKITPVATSTDGEDILENEKWTTEEEKATFEQAISEAEAVLANEDASQEAIDTAVTMLQAAITAYTDVQKAGEKSLVQEAEDLVGAAEAAVATAINTPDASNVLAAERAIAEAQAAIDALPEAERPPLQDRLNAAEEELRVAQAEVLVKIAEDNLQQSLIDTAQAAVTELQDSEHKTALQERLDAVQALVTAQAKLAEATSLVNNVVNDATPTLDEITTAEEGLTEALAAINEIGDADKKAELQEEYDALKESLMQKLAQLALAEAKENPTDNTISAAQAAIDEVTDTDVKQTLQAELDALKLVKDATDAIATAEEAVQTVVDANPPTEEQVTTAEQAITDAQDEINAVVNEDERNALQQQLDEIEQELLQKVADVAVTEAGEKVAEAEQAVDNIPSPPDATNLEEAQAVIDAAQTAIDEAQTAIDALDDSTEKEQLQKDLDNHEATLVEKQAELANVEAEVAVAIAEDLASAGNIAEAEQAVAEAQAAIDKVSDPDKKAELQGQLDTIKDELEEIAAVQDTETLLEVVQLAVEKAVVEKTPQSIAAAESAIAAAQAKITDPSTDQDTLNDYIIRLNDVKVDNLIASIEKVTTSPDGKDVAPTEQWTTQAELDALEAAITEAQEETPTTVAESEQVLADLQAAITDYNAAKQAGKNFDTSELEQLLATTSFVDVSVDGSGVPAGQQWTDAEAKSIFEAAIAAAEATLTSAESAKEIADAVTALQQAVDAYDEAKQFGTESIIETVNLSYGMSQEETLNKLGTLEAGKQQSQFTLVALQAIGAIDANIIQTQYNGLPFEVKEGETVDFSIEVKNRAGVGLGWYKAQLYKLNDAGTQYEVVEEYEYFYGTLFGLTGQIMDGRLIDGVFKFNDLEKGQYAFVAGPSEGLNVGVASAVLTEVKNIEVTRTAQAQNNAADPISRSIDLVEGAAITQVKAVTANDTIYTVSPDEAATIIGEHGTLTMNVDGTYSYKSQGNEDDIGRVDEFEFTVTKDGKTATSKLYIRHDIEGEEDALIWDDENITADAKTFAPRAIEALRDVVPEIKSKTVDGSLNLYSSTTTFGEDELQVTSPDSVLSFTPSVNRPVSSLSQKTIIKYSVYKEGSETAVFTKSVVNDSPEATEPIYLTGLEPGSYKIVAERTAGLATFGIGDMVVQNRTWTVAPLSSSIGLTNNVNYNNTTESFMADGGKLELEGTVMTGTSLNATGDYGTLTLNSDGTYTYTMKDGVDYSTLAGKKDSFEYRIVGVDGKLSDVRTITISFEQSQPAQPINPNAIDVSTLALKYTIEEDVQYATVVDASILG